MEASWELVSLAKLYFDTLCSKNSGEAAIQGYSSLGWVDLNFVVPLSAQFGLGRWKTGKSGRADMLTLWNIQI